MRFDNCACGTEPRFDSVDGAYGGVRVIVDNGVLCECAKFSCDDCSAKASALDPDYDVSLCVFCNALYLAQQITGASVVLVRPTP